MRFRDFLSGTCRMLAGAAFTCAALIASGVGTGAQAADLLGTVKQTKVITVGTSNDAPLAYIEKDEAIGFLPDVLREAMKRQGIDAKLQVTAMPFASLIPAIESDRIQLIVDAMYIRPARAKVIDFTTGIFFNPESLDVAKGNPAKLHQFADLCGHSAGTYQGTVYVEMLKKEAAACPAAKPLDVRQYPTIQNVFADLNAGRLDAAVVDSTLSAYALKQNPALNFEIVADYKPEDKADTLCAFGIAKGNDAFLKAFNDEYAKMKADGTAAKLLEKWGLVPTSFFLNP
jgi:polar amino acid transport system substrate-binding protein